MLDGKKILLTGGTGSFGKKFTKITLEKYNPEKIIIFSRDEMKQWNMQEKFRKFDSSHKIEYVIGDVRDKERLSRVADGINYIVHAAATKIVPTAESNPFECIKTNINGAMNVIDVAIDKKIEKIIALSTDKACNPINLYGATKLASDKLFVAANLNTLNSNTTFSVVRYGNVMGSRGSVVPFFKSRVSKGVLPITDVNMTRFMITVEQGINLVWHALKDALGGEIYIHKIPSMRIIDIATAIDPNAAQKVIGIRPGEKIHEVMITSEDAVNTYEYDWYYKILPSLKKWHLDPKRIKDGIPVKKDFIYSSDNNPEWMSIEELREFIDSSNYQELEELNK